VLRRPGRLRPGIIGLVLLVALVLTITIGSSSWQTTALSIVINACAALGVVVLFGFAGQISLAGGAFIGVGLYAPAVLSRSLGWSPWVGLPVGIVLAMLIAALVGYPVLKLEGLYLAMATAALNVIFGVVVGSIPLTNATYGIAGIPPLNLFGLALDNPVSLLITVVIALVILMLLTFSLIRSPMRLLFAALHHNPQAAQLAGINAHTLKIKTFVLSSAYTAVAGFFIAESLAFASPDQVGLDSSLLFIVMAVIGGVRSPIGALIGAAFVTILTGLLPQSPQTQLFIYAVGFLLVVMFLPDGLAGDETWRGVAARIRRRVRGPGRGDNQPGARTFGGSR
jgi:branched-chain amino acid transport system permease protein